MSTKVEIGTCLIDPCFEFVMLCFGSTFCFGCIQPHGFFRQNDFSSLIEKLSCESVDFLPFILLDLIQEAGDSWAELFCEMRAGLEMNEAR